MNIGKAMRLEAGDRSGRRVGHLRARPRHDVADVPGAARGHHDARGRDRRRRRERDHDEQGDDPDRAAGVLADHVARPAALGVGEPRRRPAGDRADRRGGGGASARRRRRGAVHGARRRHRGRDDRHPRRRRPRVRSPRHAVHRRGGVPDDVRVGRGAQAAVRVRVPAPERPAVRRARRRHREDELAGRRRLVRASWSRRPTASRSCWPAARGWRTRSC